MTDSKMATEFRGKLNKLIIELYHLDFMVDSPASNMTLGEYEQERERLLGEFVQAIAAMLGERRDPTKDWLLSVCNQATQDYVAELERKLEAVTFGSRECEMETDWDYLHDGIPDAPEDTWAYKCSVCDWSFRYDRGIKPKFCPNCGKAVKR